MHAISASASARMALRASIACAIRTVVMMERATRPHLSVIVPQTTDVPVQRSHSPALRKWASSTSALASLASRRRGRSASDSAQPEPVTPAGWGAKSKPTRGRPRSHHALPLRRSRRRGAAAMINAHTKHVAPARSASVAARRIPEAALVFCACQTRFMAIAAMTCGTSCHLGCRESSMLACSQRGLKV